VYECHFCTTTARVDVLESLHRFQAFILKLSRFEYSLNRYRSIFRKSLTFFSAQVERADQNYWLSSDSPLLLASFPRSPPNMSSLLLDNLTLSSPSPTLPPEIIDEILQDDQLSKADLARCCLLSRQFLPVPQARLYRSIKFNLFVDSRVSYWFHHFEAVSLLSTLESNVALRQKVKKLELLGFDVEPVVENTYSNDELDNSPTSAVMVKRILDLLPAVRSLSLNGTLHYVPGTIDLVLDYGQRWEGLSVEGFLFGTGFNATKSVSKLPNLKRLSCCELSLQVPDGLQVLEMIYQQAGSIKGSTKSRLQFARLALVDDKLQNIDTFQRLQRLSLYQGLEDTSITFLPPISKLSRLQALSFRLINDRVFAVETLPHILANLPRSLSRLEFPDAVPFAALSSFLKSSSIPPLLRVVALDIEIYLDKPHADQLAELRILCQAKKIRVQPVTDDSGVFRTSPSRFLRL